MRDCTQITVSRVGLSSRAGRSEGAWRQRAAATVLTILCGLSSGCGPTAPLDDAPLDLRGEPILPLGNLPGPGAPGPSGPSAWGTPTDAGSFSNDELGLVGFDRLAGYDYESAAAVVAARGETGSSAIPAHIQALHGTEVAIRGFMLPLKIDGGLVRELLLMRDQSMCCFGVVPNLNDWVSVKMPSPGVKAVMDQPVIIFGKLEVGEVYDHGMLSSIYRMQGEELLDALDL